MRILLDECVPRQLRRELSGHYVHTVPEMEWAGIKNGELLSRATGQFDVLITTDRNLEFQQDLRALAIAIVVLVATSNDVNVLRPLMLEVLQVLDTVQPGEVLHVGD